MKAHQIAICSLLEVEEISTSFGATHLLSLLEPGRSMPPEKAVEALFKLRPQAVPNPLVVRIWDDRLRLEGKLLGSLQKILQYDCDN